MLSPVKSHSPRSLSTLSAVTSTTDRAHSSAFALRLFVVCADRIASSTAALTSAHRCATPNDNVVHPIHALACFRYRYRFRHSYRFRCYVSPPYIYTAHFCKMTVFRRSSSKKSSITHCIIARKNLKKILESCGEFPTLSEVYGTSSHNKQT